MATVNDILHRIMPKLLDVLIRQSGASTQAELGKKAGISDNALSRYRRGINVPMNNLPDLAREGAGLDLGQLGWLLGHVLTEEFAASRFAIAGQPGEVRESAGRYDEPGVDEQVAAVRALDLTGLDPHDVVALNRQRRAIVDLHDDDRDARDRRDARLRSLLDSFLELYRLAAGRARPGS